MTGNAPASGIQTTFLGWDGPALPRAARLMAEEYGRPEGMDLRDVVVVTPAARAGRRLVELLLEEAEARSVPLTPPSTVTIGRFPELLYQATGPLADATKSRQAFLQALKKAEPGLLQGVFPELPTSLSGWMALAGIVEKLHKEVGAEGLDFHGVSQKIRARFPYDELLRFDDSSRWVVLAKVQEAYLEILRGAGLRDRDRERRQALLDEGLSSPGDVWMVGVVELPSVVKQMVEALPGPVRTLVHAPEEVRDRFDSLGCILPSEWQQVSIPAREENTHVVQRPRDQAAKATEVLRGFGGRFAAEEVVVGVPDPDLVPFVERSLSGADVPHRFAGGTRLGDTGPVRLLQALTDYLDGRSFPSFATLIRHPDLHDLVERTVLEGDEVTGALTFVDRFQGEHLQDSVKGDLPGEDRDARRTRTLVKELDSALGSEGFGGTRSLSAWMPWILEVLVTVYGARPVNRGKASVRQMVDSVTRIKGAATRLATLPRNLDLEVEASEALAILLAELTGPEVTLPPDPEEHAVELLGWLELPLDDAPAVILTGVNERTLPEAVGADPFLPGSLRTCLEIPDDGARYARDAYLLSAVIHSRKEVHLVAGRLTTKGDPLRPSRLLFADAPEEVARRVRRYLGDEDEAAAGGVAGTEGSEEERADPASRFRSPPQDPIPALDSLLRIRVTDFAGYLADPYRYALTRILRLEPLDDGAREMDGGVFGNLAHQVLERFGRSEEAGSSEVEIVEKKLNQLLDQSVGDKFGRRPVPAVRVQVEQLRARLRRFARWQADWIGNGWRVVSVEEQPEDGVPFVVDGKELRLRGKIDRIDHNPETGKWAIFDYKTGDGGKDPDKAHRKGSGQNKRWVDLQLPLYRFLLPGILKDDGTALVPEAAWEDVSLGYILLPRDLEQVGPAFANWTEADLTEAHETACQVVRDLRKEAFHYDPETRSFRDDPLDALLGRLELPRADEDEEGEG